MFSHGIVEINSISVAGLVSSANHLALNDQMIIILTLVPAANALYSRSVIYVVIVASLICSGLYNTSLKSTNAFDYGANVGDVDLEAFKVVTSIGVHGFSALCIGICLFARNVVCCAKVLPPPVMLGEMPNPFVMALDVLQCRLPSLRWSVTHSRALLLQILSSVALVYNVGIVGLYSYYCSSGRGSAMPAGGQAYTAESKGRTTATFDRTQETVQTPETRDSKDRANIQPEDPVKPADVEQSKEKANEIIKSGQMTPKNKSGQMSPKIKSGQMSPKKLQEGDNEIHMDGKTTKTQVSTLDMPDKEYFS
ncbi:unnamed protein product [Haemonchus placei]|uniref:Aa_trans domain-containing protein n=1 Tax=Haemonchus placei TaxID=6290 RepID=A0A0N4WWC1_HAEPC|nr:unnamed protein product [Haemonchus placei]